MRIAGLAVIASLALAAAGCGGGGSGAYGGGGGGSSAPKPASGVAQVSSSDSAALGQILVDGSGRTLYMFAKDAGPASTCNGACAKNWPPLTTKSAPKVSGGVAGAAVKTTKRGDGNLQVTFQGHPLYYFSGDHSAGDANGQGVNEFGARWFALSPSGSHAKSIPQPSGGY